MRRYLKQNFENVGCPYGNNPELTQFENLQRELYALNPQPPIPPSLATTAARAVFSAAGSNRWLTAGRQPQRIR